MVHAFETSRLSRSAADVLGHLDLHLDIVVTCGAHALRVSIINHPLAEMYASTSVWVLASG